MNDEEQAKRKIEVLRSEIERHNRLYYLEAMPEVTDREYDRLFRSLEELEKAFPALKIPDSPTQRIGGALLGGFESARHAVPMMSLVNTYSKNELTAFDRRIRKQISQTAFHYILEPKIDGAAISLRYENGVLAQALTRGDGTAGDNVTANIRTIRSIPLRLSTRTLPPSVLEARGEVYLDTAGFSKMNARRVESGLEPFANPRNACAGSLKLLDPREAAKRPLDAVFYAAGVLEGISLETHEQLLKTFRCFGLRTVPNYWLSNDMEEIIRYLDELEAMCAAFPFQIDGGVVKINERRLYGQLGNTARSPRWAVAYKYETEQAETTLHAISIQVGRTGVLTPVAELGPVQLAGTIVKRATLHNEDEIRRKDLRAGDRVIIEKAGEIIPAVVKTLPEKRTGAETVFSMPAQCPECGGEVEKREGETVLRCANLHCPAQVKNWIAHFASRGAMDIGGLGESLVEQLVESGLVHHPGELYALEKADVLQLERMGEKSAGKLLSSIEDSKNKTLEHLIFGLGIRHVGKGAAAILADEFKNIEALMAAEARCLETVHDIGPAAGKTVTEYFRLPETRAMIEQLRKSGVNLEQTKSAQGKELAGLTFVLTGSMKAMTRHEAGDKIKGCGGRISGSISGKVHYLVAGKGAGFKLKKAKELGIRILNEEQFIVLFNGNSVEGKIE